MFNACLRGYAKAVKKEVMLLIGVVGEFHRKQIGIVGREDHASVLKQPAFGVVPRCIEEVLSRYFEGPCLNELKGRGVRLRERKGKLASGWDSSYWWDKRREGVNDVAIMRYEVGLNADNGLCGRVGEFNLDEIAANRDGKDYPFAGGNIARRQMTRCQGLCIIS